MADRARFRIQRLGPGEGGPGRGSGPQAEAHDRFFPGRAAGLGHRFGRRLGPDLRLRLRHPPAKRLAAGAAEHAIGQPPGVAGEAELLLVFLAAGGRAVLHVQGVVAADIVEKGHDPLRVRPFHGGKRGGGRARARARGSEEQQGRRNVENEFHFQLSSVHPARAPGQTEPRAGNLN